MIGNRAEVYNRSPFASSGSVAALHADHGEWNPGVPARETGPSQFDSTFGHRPYCLAGINAALGLALCHRREGRNAIAARWRPAASMIAVLNCDSHKYLLDIPKLKNTHSDIQRYRVENISQRGAIVLNIGYGRGRDPIQSLARRVAKMQRKPMLVIGDRDGTTELIPRCGGIRMNIAGLLRGAGAVKESRYGKPLIMRVKVRMLRQGWRFLAHLPSVFASASK